MSKALFRRQEEYEMDLSVVKYASRPSRIGGFLDDSSVRGVRIRSVLASHASAGQRGLSAHIGSNIGLPLRRSCYTTTQIINMNEGRCTRDSAAAVTARHPLARSRRVLMILRPASPRVVSSYDGRRGKAPDGGARPRRSYRTPRRPAASPMRCGSSGVTARNRSPSRTERRYPTTASRRTRTSSPSASRRSTAYRGSGAAS